jgi:hypothetical protein
MRFSMDLANGVATKSWRSLTDLWTCMHCNTPVADCLTALLFSTPSATKDLAKRRKRTANASLRSAQAHEPISLKEFPMNSDNNLQLVVGDVAHGQTVLYNPQTRQLSVVAPRTQHLPAIPRGIHATSERCPLCHSKLPPVPDETPVDPATPNYAAFTAHRALRLANAGRQSLLQNSSLDYFDVLSRSVQVSPDNSRPSTPTSERNFDAGLNGDSFVQGYYERFFREEYAQLVTA